MVRHSTVGGCQCESVILFRSSQKHLAMRTGQTRALCWMHLSMMTDAAVATKTQSGLSGATATNIW